ncbi:MAG: thiamine phosphate synthase [Zetaproteobacteria bacterium]|nr:thiamine phosphate synthase [Zetaproteobacteria bacterium]
MAQSPHIAQLVFIVTAQAGKPLTAQEWLTKVRSALQGGVDAILLRLPDFGGEQGRGRLLALAAELRVLTAQFDAKLWIHSDAEIAFAVGADGVHVRFADVSEISPMRAWLRDEKMTISASCHSLAELEIAAAYGADFAFLSPVFATESHPGAPCLGVEAFKTIADAASLPIIALGGVTETNVDQLNFFSGGVAVVSCLRDADDPEKIAQCLT